jgi:hypothetical protein
MVVAFSPDAFRFTIGPKPVGAGDWVVSPYQLTTACPSVILGLGS